jgi:outer membrane receptor protein involved in Fe transport
VIQPNAPVALYRLTPIAALALCLTQAAFAADEAPPATDNNGSAASSGTDTEAPALGGVTVRSRNRIEKLQDVPLSISVVSGSELERTQSYDIDSIAKRTANFTWNRGNQRTSSLSIRGVGKIGQTEAQDPSVGVVVDGVPYAFNALTSSFDFVDIDTVEVTRGPQGTLLGKNTSMGMVVINTRKPSFTPTADYTVAFSQRSGFLGMLAAGGPVIDDELAWRGTFVVDRQRGALVNAYNHDDTYTNTDRTFGRVQLLWTPNTSFSARVAAELQPRAGETTNSAAYNTPTPATFANGSPTNATLTNEQRLARSWFTQNTGYTLADYYNGPNYDAQRGLVTGSNGASAELNWKFDSGFTLTSISATKKYHFDAVNDEGTPFDVYRNAGGFWDDYQQLSEELRLSSPVGGFVDYQAGLYAMKTDTTAIYRRWWGTDAGAWFASKNQYTTLNADAAGRLLMENSLANLQTDYNSPAGVQDIRNRSTALFGQANWHLSPAWSVTTGLRFTQESRQTTSSSGITSQGSAPELSPAVVNGVDLGGFDSDANGTLKPGNSATQLALADQLAQKYFGVANYAALTAAQLKQVAAAKALRAAQIGVVFNTTAAERFQRWQPAGVLSTNYKWSEQLSTYVSYQHGEKAGISQLVNGISALVKPEKTDSLELGFKSVLLNKTLVFDADVFHTVVKDYQQAVRVVDAYTTGLNTAAGVPNPTAYTSATGNVPKVQVDGLEVDGTYGGLPNTTLRFSGAYTRAVYKDFKNAAPPVEQIYPGSPPYIDLTGATLPGAARYTFNVGGEYRLPVAGKYALHTGANVGFTSGYNSDVALSAYGWIPKHFLVDYDVGLGKLNKSFDVSLVVKNLFNNGAPVAQTWNSVTPTTPRTVSLVFVGRI